MKRRLRLAATAVGATCALLLIVLAGVLYTSQTKWFKEKVRREIVAAVEQATGGRVELGSFDYDWRTLTATSRDFVVHGTESASAQPFFRAQSVVVTLKIISMFKRNIDLNSAVVRHPYFNLLVRADGSTNIPVPPSGPTSLTVKVQALLNLKVRHFEFDDGMFHIGLRHIPLDLRGEDTFLLLSYDRRDKRYDVKFSSRELHVDSDPLRPFFGSLNASARLERDGLSVQSAVFQSGASTVQTSGTLRHFAQPTIDLRALANVDAGDVASITKFEDVGRGNFTLNGSAHYDENNPLTFKGKIVGRDVSYRVGSVDLGKVSLQSDVLARPQYLELTHLVMTALGSRLSGQMFLKRGRDLQVDGSLAGLNLQQAARLMSTQDLPWSGVVAGPFHLRAVRDRGWRDLTLQSNLAVVPGSGALPLSGAVDLTYHGAGNALDFGNSYLAVANTRASFSGTLGANLDLALDSTNMEDLSPVLRLLKSQTAVSMPVLLQNGRAHFDGRVAGTLNNPLITGNVALAHFKIQSQDWDQLRSRLTVSANKVDFASLVLDQGPLHATADGHFGLHSWTLSNNSPMQLKARVERADIAKVAKSFSRLRLPSMGGVASATVDLQGTFVDPRGNAQLTISNVDAYGERLNEVQVAATFAGEKLQITRGHMQAGPAALNFSGAYQHTPTSWSEGQLQLKIDSNGFPLASLAPVHEYQPGFNAQFEIHGEAAARIASSGIEPLSANGTAVLRDLTVNNVPYGSLTFTAATGAQSLTTSFSGDLRGSRVTGSAQTQLTPGNPVKGEVHLSKIQLSTLGALVSSQASKLPFEGVLEGAMTFEGPLKQPDKMHGTIAVQQLQLTSNVPAESAIGTRATDLTLRNVGPIMLQYSAGAAEISSFQMSGRGTMLTASGSVPFLPQRPVDLKVNGLADLEIFQMFDPAVRSSGESSVAASVTGTLSELSVNGTLDLKNGSFSLAGVPNGLTSVNGRVRFDRDRATIEKLTAQTGGGEVSMGGFISFGKGPLVYRLEANAENVRVRYGGAVSVTASSEFRLTGTSENSILSGTATVSRVIFNPNTDIGNLLSSAAVPVASPSNEKDFLTGLQFDIHMESAPNLQLSTELSRDVEAEIDLRLRGTPNRPILLGNITANQGDIRVFGTKYTINRGEVSFVNAVKIEPVLDMDLQTQARGITVDITVSGTPGKLNINYRSDPPLQPRDIIALLTVGRAPDIASNVPNAQVTNDVSALQSGANTVLGQAISPVSNRLSKLFGITNIKIDPMVQGITNTPQARLTVEQQISRQITVTYVTNLSQTSEQIFRLEWAFSPQYSLVALRDDNGEFGIDIQYKKRFK